jgi:CHAP domain
LRKKIVAEALAEKNKPVCGTGDQQNEGEPQKYTRYTCSLGSTTSGSSYPWCAGFTGWVYGHAGAPFPRTCGAWEFMSALKYHWSIGSGIPKPGDVVQRGCASCNHHVGIVYKVVGTTLYTIEGNAGRCVQIKSYSNYGRNDWYRYGNSFENR